MSAEQIGILLVFLVIVLFNFVSGYLSHRRKQAAARRAEPEVPRPAAAQRVVKRAVMTPQRMEMPSALARRQPPRARQRRGRLELRRGDLRRAVILMTVLGPPRALEHESRDVR